MYVSRVIESILDVNKIERVYNYLQAAERGDVFRPDWADENIMRAMSCDYIESENVEHGRVFGIT